MLVEPVFIVGCPRSGTSLLSRLLRGVDEYRSTPNNPEMVWQRYLHPKLRGWRSDEIHVRDIEDIDVDEIARELDALALPADVWRLADSKMGQRLVRRLRKGWMRGVGTRAGAWLSASSAVRGRTEGRAILDKSVTNLIRLPLLERMAKHARYVYVKRNPRSNILSLMAGWQSGEFGSYRVPERLRIEGYSGDEWCFHLIDGWRNLAEAGLEEVCLQQVRRAHEKFAGDVAALGVTDRVFEIKLEVLVEETAGALRSLSEFLGLSYDRYFAAYEVGLPRVNPTSGKIERRRYEELQRSNENRLARMEGRVRKLEHALGYS
ncbi:MAG: sulfotransferase [Gammaproteobacteria bacterium]|nr:sulfotransferase [Gammaproteobacteria bacterium]NIR84254.1 sulfotransferase [Gammaproteobacteria bacterium]NIR89724.1 sulfotransferase [Gammaproteobacteria bacterium]NIU05412.1 sulfotransferase [Gammaproteobacteria bacterium]NIV52358.1 hypothetical protein [Gammaproteobacteria bacterium]